MVNKMLETLQVPALLSDIPKHQMNSITSRNSQLGNNHKPIKTRPTAGCRTENMCYYYYQNIIIITDTLEKRIEYHQSKRRKLDGQNTTDES